PSRAQPGASARQQRSPAILLVDRAPAFCHWLLVVALGGAPFIFVSARLVHVSDQGEHFRCGCEFIKKIGGTGNKPGDALTPLDARLIDALAQNASSSPASSALSKSSPLGFTPGGAAGDATPRQPGK